MKNKNHNIIESIVNQDLCTGCGACLYNNSTQNWRMDWNREGFLVPTQNKINSEINLSAIKLCPFNPFPDDEVCNEDELANIFLKDAPNHHLQVGRYYNTYVGYSEQFRLESSSGGLATHILSELLDQKIVNAIITVGEGKNNLYEYYLIKSIDDLRATSKTKYYPVTMATVLKELENMKGKVAVVGIGCFIKSVRLLQHYNPELIDKIVFTVGIICGGLKSKFFGEYLAAKAGVEKNEFTKPQFRIKDYGSTAGDYSFGCVDNRGNERQIKMKEIGDMWGSGMFKCNACDYCDDVTTELADVSLGDAWLYPYSQDGRGTSVIVTRSKLAEKLIINGILSTKLSVKPLEFDLFLYSQQGSYNHRHKALKYRMEIAKNSGNIIPPKRHSKNNISAEFKLVQLIRREIRKNSLQFWADNPNVLLFDKRIKKIISKLKIATFIYHYLRTLKRKTKWIFIR